MKKLIGYILVIAMMVALVGCGAKTKTDVYRVRVSCDTVETSNLTIYLKKFAEEAEKRSGGRLEFDIHTSGSLYKGAAGLEATQMGDLEMCLCSLSNYGELSQKVFVLSLPFVFPTNKAVFEAYTGELGQLAVEDMNNYNLELLSFFVYGGTDLSSNGPVHAPKDLAGQKVRVFGLANASFIEECGAAPAFMSGGEVTQSLSTGLINGALTGAESMVERKYYEFQTDVCALGFERADQMVVMNLEWWSELPEDLKTCITEAMESVRQDAWTAAVESEDAAREKLADYGVNVYYPTDDEMQEWYRVAEGVYDEFREMLGDELVDKAIEFRNAHKS